jgi:hypothetical protein
MYIHGFLRALMIINYTPVVERISRPDGIGLQHISGAFVYLSS